MYEEKHIYLRTFLEVFEVYMIKSTLSIHEYVLNVYYMPCFPKHLRYGSGQSKDP